MILTGVLFRSLSPSQDLPPDSGPNETAELFSGSDGETPPVEEVEEEEEDAESAVVDGDSETEEASIGSEAGHTPKAFGDSSIRKRANPFKVSQIHCDQFSCASSVQIWPTLNS